MAAFAMKMHTVDARAAAADILRPSYTALLSDLNVLFFSRP